MSVFGESKEDKIFIAKLKDDVSFVQKRHTPKITCFLDGRQIIYARSYLEKQKQVNVIFYGGTDDCERLCAGIFPDEASADSSAFDIVPITAEWYIDEKKLSHRDVLGTLIAGGIKREFIGDIRIEDGRSVFFVKADIADFIVTQIGRMGGKAVRIFQGCDFPLPPGAEFEEITSTVASPRLDCVVKALVNFGREDAARVIKSGQVLLDYEENQNISAEVCDGTVITIRGKGKYIIDRLGPETRRGRLFLVARKYI